MKFMLGVFRILDNSKTPAEEECCDDEHDEPEDFTSCEDFMAVEGWEWDDRPKCKVDVEFCEHFKAEDVADDCEDEVCDYSECCDWSNVPFCYFWESV